MSKLKKILQKLPVRVHQKAISHNPMGGYYHMVENTEVPYVTPIYKFKNESRFEEDLKFLKSYYNPISYKDWLEKKAVNNGFLLTFDDGFRELKTKVLPLLEKYNIPAIYFITTDSIDNKNLLTRNILGLILSFLQTAADSSFFNLKNDLEKIHQRSFESKQDYVEFIKKIYNEEEVMHHIASLFGINIKEILEQKPYLTSDEIKELQEHPLITIGAHSTKHKKYELMKQEQIEEDIISSASIIKNLTGLEFIPFAFPFHSKGVSDNLMKKITDQNPWIRGFFGEFQRKRGYSEFIPRFPLDNPDISLENRLRVESANYIYGRIRK